MTDQEGDGRGQLVSQLTPKDDSDHGVAGKNRNPTDARESKKK